MRNRGYSLIELLIGIAIASVLLSLAVPGFRGLIAREEAVAAINGIIGSVQFARSIAITHQLRVTFCPANGANCGRRSDWHAGGWIFADSNSYGRIDASEIVYGGLPALKDGSRLYWRSFRNRSYLRFLPNGLTDWQNGHFLYCPENADPRLARQLILNAQGRARLARDTDGDGIAEDARGRPLQCPVS